MTAISGYENKLVFIKVKESRRIINLGRYMNESVWELGRIVLFFIECAYVKDMASSFWNT